MQTQAAVLRTIGLPKPYAQSEPLHIENVELEAPGPGEVLIEIMAAGLCHSDLSVVNGDRPRPVPMAIGHEAAGIVREVGGAVESVKPGDHVVLVFVPSCGTCEPCKDGRPALCEPAAKSNTSGTLFSGHRRLADPTDGRIHHHLGCSAFARHATVSEHSVIKIDDELSFEHAALFSCAVLTGVGAVVNTAGVHTGNSIAVVGLGGIGLSAIMGAAAIGADPIVAVDIHDDKLEKAKELGATICIKAGSDAAEQIKQATGGGVDYAIECAGVIGALETAYNATRRGGTTVTASLPNPADTWSIHPVQLVAEERTIKGSYIGSANPRRDIPRYIQWFRAGMLPVDKLLGRSYSLGELNTALDELDAGHSLRQVIDLRKKD